MKIEIAKHSGYCFGVKRALKLTEEALKIHSDNGKKVYTLGSIIHNPGVVKNLSTRGLISVDDELDPEEITLNSNILRKAFYQSAPFWNFDLKIGKHGLLSLKGYYNNREIELKWK